MKSRIDLHIHSKFSGDTDSEPDEIVLHAIKAGLHGIAFTEHNSYEASEFADELIETYRDKIMIFRGVEFSSAEGHCLVFGVNTDRLSIKNASIADVARIVCTIKPGADVRIVRSLTARCALTPRSDVNERNRERGYR